MTNILAKRLTSDQVFDLVCNQLARFDGENHSVKVSEITRETSLVADLDFDSISLVGFAAAIEDALNIDALPLTQWSDLEADRNGERFTVGSFVDLCLKAPMRRTRPDPAESGKTGSNGA